MNEPVRRRNRACTSTPFCLDLGSNALTQPSGSDRFLGNRRVVTLAAGLIWLGLVLAFYLSAGVFTRFRYHSKLQRGEAEMKGGARSWASVVANGEIATAFAVCVEVSSQGYLFRWFPRRLVRSCF